MMQNQFLHAQPLPSSIMTQNQFLHAPKKQDKTGSLTCFSRYYLYHQLTKEIKIYVHQDNLQKKQNQQCN
jgi:hypothetical protein